MEAPSSSSKRRSSLHLKSNQPLRRSPRRRDTMQPKVSREFDTSKNHGLASRKSLGREINAAEAKVKEENGNRSLDRSTPDLNKTFEDFDELHRVFTAANASLSQASDSPNPAPLDNTKLNFDDLDETESDKENQSLNLTSETTKAKTHKRRDTFSPDDLKDMLKEAKEYSPDLDNHTSSMKSTSPNSKNGQKDSDCGSVDEGSLCFDEVSLSKGSDSFDSLSIPESVDSENQVNETMTRLKEDILQDKRKNLSSYASPQTGKSKARSFVLKSCLSGKKRKQKASARKSVKFGKPSAVEYDRDEPTLTGMTPMCEKRTLERFSLRKSERAPRNPNAWLPNFSLNEQEEEDEVDHVDDFNSLEIPGDDYDVELSSFCDTVDLGFGEDVKEEDSEEYENNESGGASSVNHDQSMMEISFLKKNNRKSQNLTKKDTGNATLLHISTLSIDPSSQESEGNGESAENFDKKQLVEASAFSFGLSSKESNGHSTGISLNFHSHHSVSQNTASQKSSTVETFGLSTIDVEASTAQVERKRARQVVNSSNAVADSSFSLGSTVDLFSVETKENSTLMVPEGDDGDDVFELTKDESQNFSLGFGNEDQSQSIMYESPQRSDDAPRPLEGTNVNDSLDITKMLFKNATPEHKREDKLEQTENVNFESPLSNFPDTVNGQLSTILEERTSDLTKTSLKTKFSEESNKTGAKVNRSGVEMRVYSGELQTKTLFEKENIESEPEVVLNESLNGNHCENNENEYADSRAADDTNTQLKSEIVKSIPADSEVESIPEVLPYEVGMNDENMPNHLLPSRNRDHSFSVSPGRKRLSYTRTSEVYEVSDEGRTPKYKRRSCVSTVTVASNTDVTDVFSRPGSTSSNSFGSTECEVLKLSESFPSILRNVVERLELSWVNMNVFNEDIDHYEFLYASYFCHNFNISLGKSKKSTSRCFSFQGHDISVAASFFTSHRYALVYSLDCDLKEDTETLKFDFKKLMAGNLLINSEVRRTGPIKWKIKGGNLDADARERPKSLEEYFRYFTMAVVQTMLESLFNSCKEYAFLEFMDRLKNCLNFAKQLATDIRRLVRPCFRPVFRHNKKTGDVEIKFCCTNPASYFWIDSKVYFNVKNIWETDFTSQWLNYECSLSHLFPWENDTLKQSKYFVRDKLNNMMKVEKITEEYEAEKVYESPLHDMNSLAKVCKAVVHEVRNFKI